MVPDPVPLDAISRALVIKLRHHGDVLLTSPVFSVLKRAAPQCEIDALIYGETSPMLEDHPAIAQIHAIDRNWKRQGILRQTAAESRLLSALKNRQYDLIVHLTNHPRGAWVARMTQARWGVAPKADRFYWTGSFTHFYPRASDERRHTVESNLDALRRIGIRPETRDKQLSLIPGVDAESRADALMDQHHLHRGGFVHLHPTSRWMFKAWTVEGYAELITALQQRGFPVVMTAAPVRKELDIAAAIKALCPAPPIDLSGQLSLRELGALIGRARLFIGVDSAPMHMAAAVGVPTVAMFGPSRELEWGPWGVPHRLVISDQHPCRPCGLDGCGGGKISECLTTIPVERMLTACTELLAL